jgi:hypothetical protein
MTPFLHFSGYLSAQQRLVNLYLIDPHTDYFPIRYRDGTDVHSYVQFDEIEEHGARRRVYGKKLSNYEGDTGDHIDYVLLWRISDATREGHDLNPLLVWLCANYDKVFTSSGGQLEVYRRKELDNTDGHS